MGNAAARRRVLNITRGVCLTTAFLLSTLTGCRSRTVAREQLVGIWMIEPNSRQQLPPATRQSSTSVQLFGDGTFKAQDLPGFARRLGDAPDNGTGRWKLTSRDGLQIVSLVFTAGTISNYDGELFVESPRELYYSIGDPDDWNRVSFEKHS